LQANLIAESTKNAVERVSNSLEAEASFVEVTWNQLN